MQKEKTQKEVGTINNEKGRALENEFADYMKQELGWRGYKRRVQLAHNEGSSEIDIVAEKTSAIGLKLKLMWKIWTVSAIISGILIGFGFYFAYKDELMSNIASCASALAFAIITSAALFLAYRYNNIHAWVECKNTNEQVNAEQISTLLSKYDLYKSSRSKEFRFKELYFVSANGFIENAHRLAIKRGIKCYIKEKSGKFAEASYWD